MVRNYIRKSTRCSFYNDESLKIAVESVTNGMPLKTAVKKYGVPARTLKRHQMAMTKFPGKIMLGHFHSIFTKDQELELVEIIKSMEKSLFGMTTTDVRKVAFEFAEKMKLSHPFKVEMKMAGIDWMYGFLKRHPTLSIRKPRGRKRKSERATLLTSSPNKKLLQEKDDQNCKKIKRSKDLLDIKSKTVKRTKDTTPCGTCTQIFCKDVTGRQWIKCQKCGIWHHNGCQGLEEDYNDIFICIECDD
ncbi:hypothetical protein HELRODRAFT_165447 [Helobdella robusta]|uniref:HTH psq-type domain-containing protein n=1 Tax=Helobdella robusta TaxID=6412 RepID=T1EWT4_HELRO|nr:hypothetical protein HELRODRAFT_165447 [Helobdella robusta]ESN91415.1 hypothetical protein HELRODRAFT_165447 [Helobdella robusta]